jgi:aminoglycoside phosphotransferase (APT) family kinase protein
VERDWERRYPFHDLDREAIVRLVAPAAPASRIRAVTPLTGGLRNSNFRVALVEPGGAERSVVLRLYTADPAACRREAALLRLVEGSVPVPDTLHVDPDAEPPYAVTTWVDGIRLDDLLASGDQYESGPAANAPGCTLAAIHR